MLVPENVPQHTSPPVHVFVFVQESAAPLQVAPVVMHDAPAVVMQQVCPVVHPVVSVHAGAASTTGAAESTTGCEPLSATGVVPPESTSLAGGLFEVVEPLHATTTVVERIVTTARVFGNLMGVPYRSVCWAPS